MNSAQLVAVAALVSILVQFSLFLRWVYRRIRNDQLMEIFIKDIALNHLPHIYHALRKICAHAGIEEEDAPPIQWINLGNDPRRRDV